MTGPAVTPRSKCSGKICGALGSSSASSATKAVNASWPSANQSARTPAASSSSVSGRSGSNGVAGGCLVHGKPGSVPAKAAASATVVSAVERVAPEPVTTSRVPSTASADPSGSSRRSEAARAGEQGDLAGGPLECGREDVLRDPVQGLSGGDQDLGLRVLCHHPAPV